MNIFSQDKLRQPTCRKVCWASPLVSTSGTGLFAGHAGFTRECQPIFFSQKRFIDK